MDLSTPTVHRNGTSKSALTDQVQDASEALYAAINAMNLAAPNARDYYPQGEGDFAKAVAAQQDRMRRLAEIREEMMALQERIEDQS